MELTRNQIKLVKSLSRKKERQELGLFIAEGRKTVLEALKSGWKAEFMCHLKDISDFNQFQYSIPVSHSEMERMTALANPSEALAIFQIPDSNFNSEIKLSSMQFYLDGIQDPGNLGTIIRIADWYGMNAVFCSPDCVDTFNPKTVQASMGSVFHLPVIRLNLESLKNKIDQTRKIYVADLQGENIWNIKPAKEQNCIVIIGSESHGPNSESIKLSDESITIPGNGHAASLNADVSSGIISSILLRS